MVFVGFVLVFIWKMIFLLTFAKQTAILEIQNDLLPQSLRLLSFVLVLNTFGILYIVPLISPVDTSCIYEYGQYAEYLVM